MREPMEKDDQQSADDLKSLLLSRGLEPAAPVLKVAVEGLRGPLGEGELERAFEFGRDLGERLPEYKG